MHYRSSHCSTVYTGISTYIYFIFQNNNSDLRNLIVSIRSGSKTKSVSDFVLGGNSVGSWLTAFAYGTSYFSAVVFIGYAGQFGWNYGVSSTWIGIGNAVLGSALAWLVLGKRTRLMSNHLQAKTMPEFSGIGFSLLA